MKIKADYTNLEKAIALVEDYVIKSKLDSSSSEDLKLLKLLTARERSPRFEYLLAEFICGEPETSFPYRSSFFLTEFFRDMGHPFQHDGTTRRFWTESVLEQLNIKDIAFIIRKGLFRERDFRAHAKKKNIDYETMRNAAIIEFKDFIDSCISEGEEMDLAALLNMNVNIELLVNNEANTKDEQLNILINESKKRFFNPQDKQIALEKIWDAFERIKTYYDDDKKKSVALLLDKISSEIQKYELELEFKSLTEIGNKYKIRHHEKGKIELSNEDQIDYLFFRVLALIDLCIKAINKNGN